jgi:hypothetical protein
MMAKRCVASKLIDDVGVLDFIHTWLQPGAAKREIKGETV